MTTRSSSRVIPSTVKVASNVAQPALSKTVALRKSPKRTRRSVEEGPQQLADAVGALDHPVGLLRELRRALVGADADPDRGAEAALLDELGEAAEGVEVGHVVADVHRRGEVGV